MKGIVIGTSHGFTCGSKSIAYHHDDISLGFSFLVTYVISSWGKGRGTVVWAFIEVVTFRNVYRMSTFTSIGFVGIHNSNHNNKYCKNYSHQNVQEIPLSASLGRRLLNQEEVEEGRNRGKNREEKRWRAVSPGQFPFLSFRFNSKEKNI